MLVAVLPHCAVARRRRSLAFANILTLAIGVNLLGIWWGLPNQPEAWAPDELTPLEVLEGARRGFSGGWFSPYPPFHYYLLTLVQLPVVFVIWLGWTSLDDPLTYTALFIVVRLTSVAMATATVAMIYACGRELGDEASGQAAALMTALTLPLVYYAKTANVDAPMVFWYVLALWFYLRALRQHYLRDYLGLAASAACAIATKDQALGLFALMPAALIVSDYRRHRAAGIDRPWWTLVWNPRVRRSGLLFVTILVIIENPLFNSAGLAERLRFLSGLPTGWAEVPNTPVGHLRLLASGLQHLRFSLGWPFFLIALIGLLTAVWRWRQVPRRIALVLPLVSYWMFFIMPIRYVFDRYLLPIAVTMTLFGGPVLRDLARSRRWRPLGPILAAGGVAYTLLYALSVDWLMVGDGRYVVERWLTAHVPRGAQIAAIGIRSYLPRLADFEPVYLTSPTVEEVVELGADYLVSTSAWGKERFRDAPEVAEFFMQLESGRLGYVPVFSHRGRPIWNLVSLRGVQTNLDKINPEIVVYQRRP